MIFKEYTEQSFTETENRTMADETKLFRLKLAKLQDILNCLKTHTFSNRFANELQTLETQLCTLQVNVDKEGTLNAGGKFEWVDSILIKVSELHLVVEDCCVLTICINSVYKTVAGSL